MSDVFSINFANCVCFFIWHVENLSIDKGIRNLEWAVRPLGNNKDAIPDDATAKTISLFDLILLIIAFHKYVLPVPPCP